MLTQDTKKKINNARDILVGKVPDPKAQVEQITFALIYKFMDDMDKAASELGGKTRFFSNGYDKYSWTKLLDQKLSGHERLALYGEAITKMSENKHIPQLFRDIFKDAYLPYRSPETLNLFLKEINGFSYDHSEDLGDAFEFLLSVLGSQGDAGQFRTPRHIIDFIVELVEPQKVDTILDPACGTAGFLISAYKHILKQQKKPLTPDEKKVLINNLVGYDISPDMVRLSKVNMYLHGFAEPKIYEYDTLSDDEKWDETFNVIMANPPFMTPKGGIKPHKRFSVQASKSEVLFVDYIAEHLSTNGRAGIIVPNGIVATAQTAYIQLRKLLVQDGLIAVISLPAGVFNPYSGVKTSILLLDKQLAKRCNNILFVKVENDGFDLGAQRKEIGKNDLPETLKLITHYKTLIANNEPIDSLPNIATLVSKQKILEKKDIALNAERYLVSDTNKYSDFPIVNINEYCDFKRGTSITKNDIKVGEIPVIAGGQQAAYFHNISNRPSNTITISSSGAYAGFVNFYMQPIFASDCFTVTPKDANKLDVKYLFYILKSKQEDIYSFQEGGAQPHVYPKNFETFEFPLPPIGIQQQIVNEIGRYQKVIDGAKIVVDNYKPTITIKSEWEIVKLGEVVKINAKASDPLKVFGNNSFTYIDIESVQNGTGIVSFNKVIKSSEAPSRARRILKEGDVIISTVRPNLKAFAYLEKIPEKCLASTGFAVLSETNRIIGKYLYYAVNQDAIVEQMISKSDKGQYPSITASDVAEIEIPLPPMEEQQAIKKAIDEEMQIVEQNKKLIQIFEAKIKNKIAHVWGVKDEAESLNNYSNITV